MGVERFERLRFSAQAVPLPEGFFLCFSTVQTGRDGSRFGSWKTVLAVAVPLSVSGKTVPTVPVSGSRATLRKLKGVSRRGGEKRYSFKEACLV